MPEFTLESMVRFLVDPKSVQQVNNTVNEIKRFAGRALGAIGIGISLKSLNDTVEQMRSINLALESAVGQFGDMDDIQKKILDSSKDVLGNYEDMAKNVSDLVKNNKSLFDVERATRFSEIMTKLTKLSGGSSADASSLISGLASDMRMGKLSSGGLEQLFAKAPQAIKILTDYYGVSERKLRMMAQAGMLKAKDIQKAFTQAGESVDEAFSNLPPKISDVLASTRSELKYFIAETDEMFGITQKFAEFLQKGFGFLMRGLEKLRSGVLFFTQKLGGMQNVLKLIGVVLASFKIAQLISSFNGLLGVFNKIGIKGMFIVGVIALILLAAEDFVSFLQGKDSLIGRAFEKAGINADEVREKVFRAWNGIKEFTTETFGKVKEWFDENGPKILTTIQGIVGGVARAVKGIAAPIKKWWEEGGGERLFGAIGGLLKTVKDDVLEAGGAIKEWWEKHGDGVCELIGGAFAALGEILTGTIRLFTDLWSIIKDVFNGDWDGLAEDIERLGSDIWETLKNTFAAIFDTELGQQFLDWGKDLIDNMIKGITQKIDAVKDVLKDASNKIKKFFGLEVEEEEEEGSTTHKTSSGEYGGGGGKLSGSGASGRGSRGQISNGPQEKYYVVGMDEGLSGDKMDTYLSQSKNKSGDDLSRYQRAFSFKGNNGEFQDSDARAFLDAAQSLNMLAQSATVAPETVNSVDSHDVSKQYDMTVNIENHFNGDDRNAQRTTSRAMEKSADDSFGAFGRYIDKVR